MPSPDSAPVAARPVTDAEDPPLAAAGVFGAGLAAAVRYAGLLADDGVTRGLIGPREAGRLWSRHLLNCAVVGELIGPGLRVVDVGSGAGLPGIALALRDPSLRVDLVEPLLRRTTFLDEVVLALGLGDRVRVVRGRAEEPHVRALCGGADWVTARAVAPLDRLVTWCLPLAAPEGRLALMRGATVEAELAEHRGRLQARGAVEPTVVTCGAGLVEPTVSVVMMGVRPRPRSRTAASRPLARRKGSR